MTPIEEWKEKVREIVSRVSEDYELHETDPPGIRAHFSEKPGDGIPKIAVDWYSPERRTGVRPYYRWGFKISLWPSIPSFLRIEACCRERFSQLSREIEIRYALT